MEGNLTHTRPLMDKKQYHLMEVQEMKVLLVSTSKAGGNLEREKGGASMVVEVGSFSDPETMPGLAHYLEHMLFMGSEKYPTENEYDNFVSTRGGYCNACTDGEYTQYNFEIPMAHFFPCLDIFAQCFQKPLLAKSSCDKEVNAIDNEYHLAKVDDDSRLWEVFSCDAIDGHFLRKFGWGNKSTLKTEPEANGVDVCKELRAFYDKYYKPENCKLVLRSPYSLEEMEKEVLKAFEHWSQSSAVDTSKELGDKLECDKRTDCWDQSSTSLPSVFSEVFGSSMIGNDDDERQSNSSNATRIFRIVPVKKNYHWLTMAWILPPTIHLYRCKSTDYLGHLLGHEGNGSLLSHLKSLGYASDIVAGISEDCTGLNKQFSVFSVAINLTVKGVVNWADVVQYLYQYLQVIVDAGPLQWIYDELAQLGKLEYDFQDEEEVDEFVDRLSGIMASRYRRLPVKIDDRSSKLELEFLPSPYIFWEYAPERISAILSILMHGEVKVMIMSSLYATNEEEDVSHDESPTSNSKRSRREFSDESGENSESESDSSGHQSDEDDESLDDELSEDESEVVTDTEALRELYNGPDVPAFTHLSLPPSSHQLGTHETFHTEPHFKTKYYMTLLDNDLFTSLKPNSRNSDSLRLPDPNPYIPYNLDVLGEGETLMDEKQYCDLPSLLPRSMVGKNAFPVRLCNNNNVALWHLQDNQFGLPKVWVQAKLNAPNFAESLKTTISCGEGPSQFNSDYVEAVVLNDLFGCILEDSLTEVCYMASLAHLKCEVWSGTDDEICIYVRVSGFSDKAPQLLKEVLEKILDFSMSHDGEDSIQQISRQIEVLECYYSNCSVTAGKASKVSRLNYLYINKVPAATRLNYLEQLKVLANEGHMSEIATKLDSYVQQFTKQCSLVCFLQGNVSSDSATQIGGWCVEKFASDNQPENLRQPHRIRLLAQLPETGIATSIHAVPSNPQETNRSVEFYFQVGECAAKQHGTVPIIDLKQLVLLQLMDQIITEPMFDELRTHQQLGYDVSNYVSTISCTYGYVFKIVSNSHSVDHITNALLRFVRTDMINLMQALSASELLSHANALLDKYLVPNIDLHDEAKNNWDEIEDDRYAFKLNITKSEILKPCIEDDSSQQKLLADLIYFCTYFFVNKSTCRMVKVTAGHI